MLIYKITNKINGKIYIGQTTRTLKERWADYIKVTYCKGSKIFNKVLPEYKYLVNTVLSSDNEKV